MKKTVLILFALLLASLSFAQADSLKLDKKANDRYVAWLIPSASQNIYGLAIGIVGSEAVCNRPYTKHSHGINLQIIGQGLFQTFFINRIKFKDLYPTESPDSLSVLDTEPKRAIHNGLLVSPFGTFTDQVNGISLSSWMSMGKKINGISLNLLWNYYKNVNGITIGFVNHTASTKGLQVGLVNKTIKLKGFQIGLWNKNEKRALPLINWCFKDLESSAENVH